MQGAHSVMLYLHTQNEYHTCSMNYLLPQTGMIHTQKHKMFKNVLNEKERDHEDQFGR
jgi:hypothetical protein